MDNGNEKTGSFLILAFLITYVFWGLDGILSRLGMYEHPAYNIGLIFYIIAACSPAIAVVILKCKEKDKQEACSFFKSIFKPNKLGLEILFLLFLFGVRFGVPALFGDVHVTGAWWQIVVYSPIMIFFGGFEEVGWRGYLQPILEKKFGFIIATLINCAIWIL